MADLQGFEPRQSEPESLVLPLHHRSALWCIIYHEFVKMQMIFLKNSQKIHIFSQISHKISEMLVFHFFSAEENWSWESDFVRFCFARAKRACAMRRATSGAAFKMVCS